MDEQSGATGVAVMSVWIYMYEVGTTEKRIISSISYRCSCSCSLLDKNRKEITPIVRSQTTALARPKTHVAA